MPEGRVNHHRNALGGTSLFDNATATNVHSVALGRYANSARLGAFTIGDGSTATSHTTTAVNQFMARFVGGYRLLSNAAGTVGVSLATGGGSWAAISDRWKKENTEPLNPEETLMRVCDKPVTRWSYLSQPARNT